MVAVLPIELEELLALCCVVVVEGLEYDIVRVTEVLLATKDEATIIDFFVVVKLVDRVFAAACALFDALTAFALPRLTAWPEINRSFVTSIVTDNVNEPTGGLNSRHRLVEFPVGVVTTCVSDTPLNVTLLMSALPLLATAVPATTRHVVADVVVCVQVIVSSEEDAVVLYCELSIKNGSPAFPGSIPIVSGIPSRICLVSSRFSALTMAGFGRTSFGASGTMRPDASMAARAGFTIM
jgi:hypothetical protein